MKKSSLKAVLLLFAIAAIFSFGVGCSEEEKPTTPAAYQYDQVWKFGIMADTQWTPRDSADADADGVTNEVLDPEGLNTGSVAGGITQQLNQEFIDHGVKFVMTLGDMTDDGSDEGMNYRAQLAEELYDAGIGFFPLRGNHSMYYTFFFPDQPNNGYSIPVFKANFPQTKGTGSHLYGARNFSSPDPASDTMKDDLNGLSYSFEYGPEGGDATFVIIDDWATENQRTEFATLPGVYYGYTLEAQFPWIESKIALYNRTTKHAFVFAHQPMIAENHNDSIFGGSLNMNKSLQNEFIGLLDRSKVAFYFGGHDHLYNRSIIESPDGLNKVEQIIGQSACPKFYGSYNDSYSGWYGEKVRSHQIAQEFGNIGYYIVTVDSDNITVDYYSHEFTAPATRFDADKNFPFTGTFKDVAQTIPTPFTPDFNFVKKDTTYYIMGTEFVYIKNPLDLTSSSLLSDSYAGLNGSDGSSTYMFFSGENSTTTHPRGGSSGGYTSSSVDDEYLVRKVACLFAPSTDFETGILTVVGTTDFGPDPLPNDGLPKFGDTFCFTIYTDDFSSKSDLATIQADGLSYIIQAYDEATATWVNAANLTGTPSFVGQIDDLNPNAFADDYSALDALPVGSYGTFRSIWIYSPTVTYYFYFPFVKVNYEGKFALSKQVVVK